MSVCEFGQEDPRELVWEEAVAQDQDGAKDTTLAPCSSQTARHILPSLGLQFPHSTIVPQGLCPDTWGLYGLT